MAKTIADYKMDYDVARALGDAAAMREANDAANAIRTANGEAAQVASQDIANTAIASAQANTANRAQSTSSASTTDQINSLYDAYLKKQLDALSAQETQITPQYAEVRNNAATTMAQNKNAFNEYAAASGLNIGAGGQAELARQNVYGNALNAADVAEAQARQDIAAQRSEAQSTVEAERNQAIYDELVRQQNLQAGQEATAAEQQQAAAEAQYSQLEDYAKSLAAIGDYSGYQQLYGWTDAQVAQADALFKQQNAAKTTSTTSTPTGTTTKSLTYSQAKALADKGQWSTAVLNTLRSYFTDSELASMYPELEATASGTTVDTRNQHTTASATDVYNEALYRKEFRGADDGNLLSYITDMYMYGNISLDEATEIASKLGLSMGG